VSQGVKSQDTLHKNSLNDYDKAVLLMIKKYKVSKKAIELTIKELVRQ
jgi:hypothetical protein